MGLIGVCVVFEHEIDGLLSKLDRLESADAFDHALAAAGSRQLERTCTATSERLGKCAALKHS